MKRHHGLLVLTTLAAAVLLAGCWGATKGTAVQITGGSSVADTATAVGIDKCFTCHAGRLDVSNPADNGVTIFNMWAASKHGNNDPASHASYANFAADPTCGGARCHDPNGDGMNMLQTGSLNRPVVGCEACHGGGSEHFGVGPMAYPFPNATACAKCHNATSPPIGHLGFHPNGFGGKGNPGIYEAYAASPHTNSINTHVRNSDGSVITKCSKCHTDEGARRYSLVDNITALDCTATYPAGLANASAVQCRTCHKAHGAGVKMLKDATANSAQYNTCIACHQDAPQIHSPSDPLYPHPNQITAKHAVGVVTVGLIVNPASANGCTECHNPHSADLTENLQWANAGHGDNNSGAFSPADNFSVQDSCGIRCHTTTGYVVYTDNQLASATTANFTANGTTGGKQETIYCRACHKINAATGYTVARRTPQAARIPGDDGSGITSGNFTTIYTTIPGQGDSELCMNCHGGRLGKGGYETAAYVASKTVGLVSIDNIAFGNTSHHGVAVFSVFQDNTKKIGGYALPGKDYTNVSYYKHNVIGTTAQGEGTIPVDNSTGPCVGCHMSSPNVAGNNSTGKHSFLPFTYDNVGNVTAVTAAKCAECHAGQYALTAAEINAAKAMFAARLAEFDNALRTAGLYPAADFGNYFTDNTLTTAVKNWNTRATNLGTGITGVDLFGIGYNRYYLAQDWGAYAHNDVYANRLIYDAIKALGGTPLPANWPAADLAKIVRP